MISHCCTAENYYAQDLNNLDEWVHHFLASTERLVRSQQDRVRRFEQKVTEVSARMECVLIHADEQFQAHDVEARQRLDQVEGNIDTLAAKLGVICRYLGIEDDAPEIWGSVMRPEYSPGFYGDNNGGNEGIALPGGRPVRFEVAEHHPTVYVNYL